ncbi:MAG: D-alanyl-D-alanine carboxypeptidase [Clostridia bacterium]|nr:D-alanyl-D-alanine carboxypeptidase [Clostridia bacterium]
MKLTKFITFTLVISILFSMSFSTRAVEIKDTKFDFDVKSALLMDAESGQILYAYRENECLPPASVTKIMTLLLTFEAIEDKKIGYDTIVTISEYAASMGGSQVYLEPGEQISVNDLLKCVFVSSANDGAVALAELVCGSEEEFVNRMNERAEELGMKSTHFENVTGLDDDTVKHFTSALDIAIMSRELLKFPDVTNYSKIWMDTIRNGEFGLTNTNKLVRYYKGITGLKTGSTDKAGFCVSASAKRENLHLIAVIMGADTSKNRNIYATKLLDYGFANYTVLKEDSDYLTDISVLCGQKDSVKIGTVENSILMNKADTSKIRKDYIYENEIKAPVKKNQVIGKVVYYLNDKEIDNCDIVCLESVECLTFFQYFFKFVKNIF